ncbi:MAG TPA: phenylacetate--CoA ligase [Nitrososphaerales archaeon]|nr:phenylacetate--CoA ligase [Nitrososphaerales archaeon]
MMNERNHYHNEKMETLPQRELAAIQEKRFREILQYSYDNSVFYKKSLDRLGLKPEDVRSIRDLQDAKFFTTKDDLRLSYPFGMLAVPREKVVEMHATSGTTGTPALGLHTEKDLRDWGEVAARSLVMSGLTSKDVFQITPSLGMFSGGFGFYHGARAVGCTIVPASAGFSKRQIQFMLDFGTTMFSAIVSYAFRLAEVAAEMGIDPAKDTKVRKGIFGSEIWTKGMKQKVSELWDMEPFDVYGFTELCGPGVGNDCSMHDGLHMWQDYYLIEVVDPKTGEPLGAEEEGELVFTTLTKEAMPLIRYRSRDVSKLLDSPPACECGRTHRKYREIRARVDDMLKISGVNFWPSEVETVLLKEKDLGPEYRIHVYTENSVDRVRISVESRQKVLGESERSKLAGKLANDLHDVLLFKPEVEIVAPNSLPRVEVGKAVRVVDERKKTSLQP